MLQSRRRRGWPLVIILLAAILATALPLQWGHPASAASQALASVRYIKKGLTVQPPHQAAGKGKVKQSLYAAYQLQTKQTQIASIGFQDGTLLHMNQLTNATLRSASVTQVKKGEVVQEVVPGTNHQVQTPSAVASAIGTMFDVQVNGALSIFTVIEGAVLVSNSQGSVVVTTGEQVRVRRGEAPGSPTSVDAAGTIAWTSHIPPPPAPLGLNIALAANGGSIYASSSQRADPGHGYDAQNANDGRLDRGWQSADGQTSGQWLRISFQGGEPYPITAVFLDCAATGGQDPNNALKDFSVEASDDANGGFKPAISGVCQAQDDLQVFPLSTPVTASYLQLSAQDNHGGSGGIAVAEIGVISGKQPAVLGTPTPTATATPTAVPTNTPVPTAISIPALLSAIFTPVTVTSCTQIQEGTQLCGPTGPNYAYICDLRTVQTSEVVACAGAFTDPHCAPPPGVMVSTLPYDCAPVIVSAAPGTNSLYIFLAEATASKVPYPADATHFSLQGPNGASTAAGAVPPGVSGPYTQPFMPTTLTGAQDSQLDLGWVRFSIAGAGTYSLHWAGPGGDVVMGSITVS